MENLSQVFLLSMTPVGELRLSIPVGIIIYQLKVLPVLFVSVIGNMVPALFILLFFKKTSVYFSKKYTIFKKLCNIWENNTKEKYRDKIQKYGVIGLTLFIAIPLPLTGAYTGALLAVLMGISLRKSFFAVFLGVIIAGILVTLMVMLGINVHNYFGWQVLLGAILFVSLIYLYFKKRNY